MIGHKPHSLEYFPIFSESLNSFVHYTCNSPSDEVLESNGISTLGQDFGCKDCREVLKIPLNLYLSKGFKKIKDKAVLNMNLEILMRDL